MEVNSSFAIAAFAFCAAVAAAISKTGGQRHLDQDRSKDPPTDYGLPFIGKTLQLVWDPKAFFASHTGIWRTRILGREVVIVSTAEHTEVIYRREGTAHNQPPKARARAVIWALRNHSLRACHRRRCLASGHSSTAVRRQCRVRCLSRRGNQLRQRCPPQPRPCLICLRGRRRGHRSRLSCSNRRRPSCRMNLGSPYLLRLPPRHLRYRTRRLVEDMRAGSVTNSSVVDV